MAAQVRLHKSAEILLMAANAHLSGQYMLSSLYLDAAHFSLMQLEPLGASESWL